MAGKRRGNGEGGIRPWRRRDPQTGAWKQVGYEARVTLADGRRKSLYGKTRAEVARKLAATIRDRDQGVLIAREERQTVAAYLTAWLETIRPTVEASTWERYELDVRRHLIPALGRTRLARLTAQQVQVLIAEKLNGVGQRALAPRSVRNIRAVLRRALGEAQALGLVSQNVAALVRSPKASRGEMRVYDEVQVRRLLDAASGDRLEALWVLAVTTGMREGELLGLQWKYVNLEGRYLQVQTQVRRLRDAGLVLKDVKTGSSRRKIELPDLAVEALRRHRARQAEERLRMGEAWHDLDLVFPTSLGTPMDAQNLLERSHRRLVRRAELPYIRFHDLRHTAATLLLLKGVHIKQVSEMLGHASPTLTLGIYSHVLPSLSRDAASAMDALLGVGGSRSGSELATESQTAHSRPTGVQIGVHSG